MLRSRGAAVFSALGFSALAFSVWAGRSSFLASARAGVPLSALADGAGRSAAGGGVDAPGCSRSAVCGAGAAGPALEGGVVRTGMRASEGAVERVKLTENGFELGVIGGGRPEGICGSGIIDLLAELFLAGWIDLRGKFVPEKSEKIQEKDGMYAVEYAPGLFFYQSDVDEFLRTKAAASTMVEYMLGEAGIGMNDISEFYVAGAFGKHVSKESAVTIGMYPDMDREKLLNAGNSSLEGAGRLLLDKKILDELDDILDKMVYIQFGAVDDFLELMVAAQALPHTDLERYPSVMKKLEERSKMQKTVSKKTN